MSVRLKKLVGMTGLLFGLILYILLISVIATALLPQHWAAQIAFYLVAGTVWAFPVRYLMIWMNRPE